MRTKKHFTAVAAVALLLVVVSGARAQYPAGPQVTKDGTAVRLEDYANLPLSSQTRSNYTPQIDYTYQLGRVNFLRQEPLAAPLAASRLFVCDQNRNLYIIDKTTRAFTAYLNFEEVFPRLNNFNYASGIVTFEFDPAYASNGRFYTVHTETNKNSFYNPVNTNLPGLNTNGYTSTTVINPPNNFSVHEAVLIEWTDTNIANATFEGTARELMRVGYGTIIHPMADLIFNPLVGPGDPDYGNLYIATGDGGAGETTGVLHTVPQRLDALPGKVLRITPDLTLHPTDQLGANGRYRIPTSGSDTNPFVALTLNGLKKEIYCYGFRNIHRLAWDTISGKLILSDIGHNSYEEVNFAVKGGNFGWSEREGPEQFFAGVNGGTTGSQRNPVVAFPNPDTLSVTGLVSAVTPLYPVAFYTHWDGDANVGGFVYRGSLMPALYGKYIWGDITTGRLFYCDYNEMLAADDGDRLTTAPVHELQVVFNGMKRRVFDILSVQWHAKGGSNGASALPGGCGGLATGGSDYEGVPYGCGRADIRIGQDREGELYVLSKSDGMVRKLTAALLPPTIESVVLTNNLLLLTWPAISNQTYRVQFKTNLTDTAWSNLPGDVTATNASASKTDFPADTTRFYRLRAL